MAAGKYHSPRRADAAAATRAAILAAARELFMTAGYAGTTVPRIAKAARVAVPTVYTSAGGKADILAALLLPITEDEAAPATLAAAERATGGAEIIALLGEGTRQTHERHWDTISGLFPQSRAEPAALAVHERILAAYSAAVGAIAARLAAVGALRPGLTGDDAHDILWFYFGDAAWLSLVRDRGWTFVKARDFLVAGAQRHLLPQ